MTREVCVPFQGFYHSNLSAALDCALERTAEHEHEKQESEYSEPENRVHDKRLVLPLDDYYDALFKATDHSAGYLAIAKDYASMFNKELTEALGFDVGLTFATMTSPREYNFETDRVFCNITDEAARALFTYSATDGHATFRELIKERHTSRSGFSSFYSTDDDHWFKENAPDWYDHNETATLLQACMRLSGMDKERPDKAEWLRDIEDTIYEHDYEYEAAAVDWPKFTALIEEKRNEIRAKLAETDPEFARFVAPCPLTLDLFNPA